MAVGTDRTPLFRCNGDRAGTGFHVLRIDGDRKQFPKEYGIQPHRCRFHAGLCVRRTVGVPLTLSNELFRTDGVQNYENNFRMGISAGYNILSGHGTLVSLSAAFGGSVYTQYHRSLYYDLCAKWGTSAYFKPLVGLGVRYYQSLGNTGRDRLCLYVSIGFRFN